MTINIRIECYEEEENPCGLQMNNMHGPMKFLVLCALLHLVTIVATKYTLAV